MNPMILNQDDWQRRESAKIPDEFFIIPLGELPKINGSQKVNILVLKMTEVSC